MNNRWLAGALVVGILGVAAFVSLDAFFLSRSKLEVGDAWVSSATGRPFQPGAAKHILLYSPDCAWCDRQIPELEKVLLQNESGLELVVAVIVDFEAAKSKLAGFAADHSLDFMARRPLERQIGPIATPTHVIVDETGHVAAIHKGFLAAPALTALRSAGSRETSHVY